VGWARLITANSGWALHSDQDPKLARFIGEQTTLNIDPVWYSVSAVNVTDLCAYPFIYAKDLTQVRDRQQLRNIGEYLRRGGFLCIDPCTTRWSSYTVDDFLRRHTEIFAAILPGCTVRALADDDPLYRCYFTVTIDDVFSRDMVRAGASRPAHMPAWGVYVGGRMTAVIHTSGLECGWPQTPGRVPGCEKLIVNTYVYAMTRGLESP
jgi:hypothetical protein